VEPVDARVHSSLRSTAGVGVPQEDEGNVEYKYRIKDPHPGRLQQLVGARSGWCTRCACGGCFAQHSSGRPLQITQMKFRLSEGRGECFYYIGALHLLQPASAAAQLPHLPGRRRGR
jgi:hypothetical protein